MNITKSKLKQIIKEEIENLPEIFQSTLPGINHMRKKRKEEREKREKDRRDRRNNRLKKDKLKEGNWSDKYEALEAETLAKLQGYPEEDIDVLEILADAVDSHWFLRDDEDKSSFIWDIVSAKPELGDAQVWVDEVFEKLYSDAEAAAQSQAEDEATNPW